MPETYDQNTPVFASGVGDDPSGVARDQNADQIDDRKAGEGLDAASYWIQARAGDHWRNLESLSDPQATVDRVATLVEEGAFDALKLVAARFVSATGRTAYTTVISIEGRDVVESGSGPIAEQILETLLRTSPEQHADQQGDLDRWRLDPAVATADAPKSDAEKTEPRPEATGVMAPMLREAFDRLSAAHPEVREALAFSSDDESASDTALRPQTVHEQTPQKPTFGADGDAEPASPALFLRRDAAPIDEDPPDSDRTRPADETALFVSSGRPLKSDLGPRPSSLDARIPERVLSGAQPGRPSLTRRRSVWLGGVLAGAFVVGLGIAALNPEAAIRFYAAVAGGAGDADRRATVDYPAFPSVATTPPAPIESSVSPASIEAQPSQTSALAALIETGDVVALRTALQAGANANARTSDGAPLLLSAARSGSPGLVDALLSHGADPMAAVGPGETVLHAAAAEGLTESVRLLLAAGAPVDAPGGPYGCLTPLGAAASQGQAGAVAALTEAGARASALPGCDSDPRLLAAAYPSVSEYLATADRRAQIPEATPPALAPVSALEEQAVSALAANPLGSPAETVIPAPDRLENPRPPTPAAATRIALRSDAASVRSGYPTVQPEPRAQLIDPATIEEALADLIENGDADEISVLLSRVGPDVDLASLGVAADDQWGQGPRAPVDQAVLTGKLDHAAAMMSAGIPPSDDLLHAIVENPSDTRLLGALPLVLQGDVNVNAQRDGRTPLMTAAGAGAETAVAALLANGADPAIRSDDGRTAVAFARESGVIAVRERLAIAAKGAAYEPLMFGLTWYDTLESAQSKTDVCRDVIDGFVACKLKAESWLDDTAAVVAQFDMQSGGRLVAIQLDSALFANELVARQRFDDVVAIIDNALPPEQAGFPVRETALEQPFFEGLKPSVGSSDYYHYWPDQDGALPVYIHLKMIGHEAREGYYRVLIGNPFRVG